MLRCWRRHPNGIEGFGSMDLQLWRWSTAVQMSSALLIALFFLVFWRSTERAELRIWVAAWIANLLAMSATMVYWLRPSQSEALLVAVRVPYVLFKVAFAFLLIVGAINFSRRQPGRRALSALGIAVVLYGLVAGLLIESIDMMRVVVPGTIGLTLCGMSIYMTIMRQPSCGWLAVGFAMRGGLGIAESAASATRMVAGPDAMGGAVNTFVAMSSSLDAGAEWLIALGCVLALYDTIGKDLSRINTDLEVTKEELRILSHRDPLTGVFNRRRLPDIMHDSRLTGATILFFDLDDFKDINDIHGHHVGDEALRRFARVLQSSFRPGDHVIRYAGDEFLVVGQGIEQVDVRERISVLRETLLRECSDGPPINFAVGEAYLPVGGDPEAAIRAADAAMYRRKGEAKRRA